MAARAPATTIRADRGVAQPGSATALGAVGRGFKSSRPDHFSNLIVISPAILTNETELFIIGHQMSNPIITTRLIAFAPALMLAASVLISMTSGNDKAPSLVLGTLALNLAVMLFYGICIAAGQRTYKLHITVNFATLFYAVAVIFASRQGWIDSFWFLGLR